MELFDLDDDAVRLLCSLLDYDDLEALTSVSTAARRSLFREIREARPAVLTLPLTSEEHARSLLRGLKPTRLTQFAWVNIQASWQIDLLVACGLRRLVRNIRVTETATDSDICEQVPLLTGTTKLHMGSVYLADVTPLARMPQLLALELGVTDGVKYPSLSKLTNLQSLVMRPNPRSDLSFLQDLVELRDIQLSSEGPRWIGPRTPSLATMTKLRTVNLRECVIPSVEHLLVLAASLDRLQLDSVIIRGSEDWYIGQSEGEEDERAHFFAQLKGISARNRTSSTPFATGTLSRVGSRLELTAASIEGTGRLHALAVYPWLNELNLDLEQSTDRGGAVDFSGLLSLVRLTKLDLSRQRGHSRYCKRHDEDLTAVLEQMTQLERLTVRGPNVIPAVSKLINLEQLDVDVEVELASYDWILPLRQLRRLRLSNVPRASEVSGIGSLVWLEELTYHSASWECDGPTGHGWPEQLAFLNKLVNLTSLELYVDHFHDASVLRGMPRLEKLTVGSTCRKLPTDNVGSLAKLTRLRELNIAQTSILDVSPLLHLPRLRSVWISQWVECTLLVTQNHPKLLHVHHPQRDCMRKCGKRLQFVSEQSGGN